MTYHIPVMAEECIAGLNINPAGRYVDVTYGGGGHSRLIIEKLEEGRLIAFDRDRDAAEQKLRDPRFIFIPHNYRFLQNFLEYHKLSPVDGILADLGVSSHQLDEASRGFSFRFEGPLDLRMDNSRGISAAEVLNRYEEKDLIHLFSYYGEIKNARSLVRHIVAYRKNREFSTTQQLVEAIAPVTSTKTRNKYLALVFQALRLEVNDELESLKDFLRQSVKVLKPGGRLVVLTYHSLEDRLVKNFMRSGNIEGRSEKDFYGKTLSPFKLITRKPVVASETERAVNNRARSARLRIAEKIEA